MAAAALYLLWLCGSHFFSAADKQQQNATPAPGETSSAARSLAVTALSVALTDLAFSLDSVAAAVAVSDRLALVISGGVIGVIALRLSSGLFTRLLQIHTRLESAGYLAVGLVGTQLLLRLVLPNFDLPEWALLLAVAGLFLWGFSGPRNSPSEVTP
jgi:predicted tellurium resistance membrane protein TerC